MRPLDALAADEIGSIVARVEAIDLDLDQRGQLGRNGARSLLEHPVRLSRELRSWLKEFGGTPKARADFARAIALKPNYAEAFYNRATTASAKGDFEQAIGDFDTAIRLKPDYAEAFYNRGSAYDQNGQYELAVADYDQAIRLKPGDAGALVNRCWTRAIMGAVLDRALDVVGVLALARTATTGANTTGREECGAQRSCTRRQHGATTSDSITQCVLPVRHSV